MSGASDQSPSLVRATLDATADGILVVDRAGRVTAYNQAFAELWSIPAEVMATHDDSQLLGFVIAQIVDPGAFLAKVEELYAAPLRRSHDEIRLRSGRIFARYSQPQLIDDQPVGRVWSFRDVTAERTAIAALRDRDVRLRAVFEHGSVGIAEVAPDGSFLSANGTLSRMLGYDAPALLARRYVDVVHPDDLAACLAARDRAVATGAASYEFDERLCRRDGSVLWVRLHAALIRDDDGRVSRLILVLHDVSSQHQAQAALVRSERALAEAQRVAKLGSWRRALDSDDVESSPEHLRIYGLPPGDAVLPAAVFQEACLPEDRAASEAFFAAAVATRRAGRTRFRIRDRAGAVRHVEVTLAFSRDAAGRDEVIGTTQDVTDHAKLQAQLALSDRLASIGSLAAGVAHEINNPLAALLGNLELMIEVLRDRGAPTEVDEMLRDATEAAERIRAIARDLRVFARGDDDAQRLIDVVPLLESTLRMANNELRHRAQVVRLLRPVPPVRGNPSRLGQVFLNLIVNAAQAIAEGDADHHQVTISTGTSDDGRVVIEIADTGCGIAAAELPNLFRPFYTTKPSSLGTGLGLVICQRIVTELGGEIDVRSAIGEGTTFRVVLPPAEAAPSERSIAATAPAPQTEPAPTAPAPPAAPTAPAPRRARVLVIDDEALVGQIARRALAAHDVTVFQSAHDALDLLRAGQRYDVILCDVMMPSLSGGDFYRALAEVAPAQRARVVFMTGGAFTAGAQEFLDTVAAPRLDKPLDLARLRAAVAAVADRPDP